MLRKMRNDERERNEEKKEEEEEKAAEEEKQDQEQEKAAEDNNDTDLNHNVVNSSLMNVEEAEEEEDEDSDLRHGNDAGGAHIEEDAEDVVIEHENKDENNNNDSNANDPDDAAAVDAFLEEDSDDAEDEDDDVKTEGFNYIEYVSYSIGGKKYHKYKENVKWSKKLVKWRGKRNIVNGDGLLWLCTMDPSKCNKTYGRSTTLKEHMEDHHVLGDTRDECEWDDCFKTYSKRSAVINHITTKHLAEMDAAYKYSCKQCGQAHEHSMAAWRCCKPNDTGHGNNE